MVLTQACWTSCSYNVRTVVTAAGNSSKGASSCSSFLERCPWEVPLQLGSCETITELSDPLL